MTINGNFADELMSLANVEGDVGGRASRFANAVGSNNSLTSLGSQIDTKWYKDLPPTHLQSVDNLIAITAENGGEIPSADGLGGHLPGLVDFAQKNPEFADDIQNAAKVYQSIEDMRHARLYDDDFGSNVADHATNVTSAFVEFSSDFYDDAEVFENDAPAGSDESLDHEYFMGIVDEEMDDAASGLEQSLNDLLVAFENNSES